MDFFKSSFRRVADWYWNFVGYAGHSDNVSETRKSTLRTASDLYACNQPPLDPRATGLKGCHESLPWEERVTTRSQNGIIGCHESHLYQHLVTPMERVQIMNIVIQPTDAATLGIKRKCRTRAAGQCDILHLLATTLSGTIIMNV